MVDVAVPCLDDIGGVHLVIEKGKRYEVETTIDLTLWMEEETHEDAIEKMRAEAVVPFGTAMWPV